MVGLYWALSVFSQNSITFRVVLHNIDIAIHLSLMMAEMATCSEIQADVGNLTKYLVPIQQSVMVAEVNIDNYKGIVFVHKSRCKNVTDFPTAGVFAKV